MAYNVDAAWKNDPEMCALRKENLAAREHYSRDGIKQLAAAICLQAVLDYKRASRGHRIDKKEPAEVIEECRRFFREDFFKGTAKCWDPEKIEKMIRDIPYDYTYTLRRD